MGGVLGRFWSERDREREDELIVGWKEMERERKKGRVMDGAEDGVVKKEEGRQSEICPVCSIIIQCVSIWLCKDIIKKT